MRSRPPHGDTSSGHQRSPSLLPPGLALAFLAVGAFVRFTAGPSNADVVWMVGLVVTGAPVVWRTLRRFASGHFATDLVATLAVTTSVILLHPLAGLVIVLMQTGGEALERYAEGRASAAVRALEEEAPRIAHRFPTARRPCGARRTRSAWRRSPWAITCSCGRARWCRAMRSSSAARRTSTPRGSRVSRFRVRAGTGTRALERQPQPRRRARRARHGAPRAKASTRASSSWCARRRARRRRCNGWRTGTRSWFTPITLLACAATYVASGDPERVLAVLVVATPCPLILATPIAIIGGSQPCRAAADRREAWRRVRAARPT